MRRGSHSQLPARDRDVHAHILINVAGARATTTPRRIRDEEHADAFEVRAIDDSPEVRRYALKLESYLIIQKIERELARGAVDAGINRNIITRPDRDSLGFMTYDEPVRFVLRPGELRVDTFFAYGYGAQEIQFAIDIIKRLFARQSVWFARDLIGAVRAPPFGVWSNPALISDASITIALAFLISASSNATSIGERAVIVGGAQFLVVASGGASRGARAVGLRDDDCFFLAPVETVEVAGIARSRALVDVESFMRGAHYESEDVIPIDQFELRTSFEESILATLRADFAGASLRERGAKSARVIDIARMRGFLVLFSADQQRIVAQQMVENAALRDEFGALYDFLDALGLFIHWRYVSKYRDVARRFTSAARDDETPVAYGDGGSVRIFSGEEWFSVGRAALNMHTEYTENAIVVGIYHQFPYNVKFQLREPIHKLRALRMRGAKLRDARTIERGSVCVTKSRRAIEHSAQRLGIRAREIKAARTSGQLCAIIQLNLLGKEIEARRARSAMKFVYGWWNAVPSATA
ncbi:MAG: hypothetical protein M0R66_09685 [Candidatus Omnitrophica bacterium]|nr:hypothetical protein [Candidatus Omnitrophota bacterium]